MLPFIKTIFNHRFFLWFILAIPAPALLADIFEKNRYYAEIMYESGLLSVQLMVLALSLTPLQILFKNWPSVRGGIRWLVKRRRTFGVASFSYAALHTFFYLREVGSVELAWLDLNEKDLVAGWLAFAILLTLAITSNSFSVHLLGSKWKSLQKWAYAAGLLTALHWFWINQFLQEMLIWSIPLAALQIMRFSRKA